MKLINIGFGNMVSAGRVVAVVSPDSAPVKRLVKEARERGMLIDASYGRSTRAVLIMDSDHVVLSALQRKRWPTVRQGRRAKHQQRRNRPMANDKYLFVVSGARYRQGQRGEGTARSTPGDRKDCFRHHPRTASR